MQKCDISEAKARDVTLDRDCIDSDGINAERVLCDDGIDDDVVCDDAADIGAVCCNAAMSTALLTASMAESNR